MTIPVFLPLSLLLGAPCIAALDLYIVDRFMNADRDDCNVCGHHDGCTNGRQYYVEGECINHGDLGFAYFDYADFDEAACMKEFSDETCGVLTNECAWKLPLGACEAPHQVKRYENHCIKSNGPSGDYAVPMVKMSKFDSMESCESKANLITEFLRPADINGCVTNRQVPTKSNEFHLGGSLNYQCVGEMLVVKAFTDNSCQTQVDLDESHADAYLNSAGQWVSTFDSGCSEYQGDYIRADCSATLYCKSMVGIDSVTIAMPSSGHGLSIVPSAVITASILGFVGLL